LITFLIPLDFGLVDCGGCAQLGSRDINATPPRANEDEINSRLFMMCPRDDIGYCYIDSIYAWWRQIGLENSRGFTLINTGRISQQSPRSSAFIRGFDLRNVPPPAAFLSTAEADQHSFKRSDHRAVTASLDDEFNPVSGDDLAPFELWGLAPSMTSCSRPSMIPMSLHF
jgi:hypothetical protein